MLATTMSCLPPLSHPSASTAPPWISSRTTGTLSRCVCPNSHSCFKPLRLLYLLLPLRNAYNEFRWARDQEVKNRHCFENWKLLIFWTQQWSFLPPPVSFCCSCSTQRAKALSLHSGREGEPLSRCTGWRCVVMGHNGYAQMLMRAHGMMGVWHFCTEISYCNYALGQMWARV